MNIRLPFGFEIRNTTENDPSFVTPNSQDGALEQIQSGAGFFGYSFNSNQVPKSEVDQINRYRQVSQIAEVNDAIEEIIADAITISDIDDIVKIDLVNAKREIPKAIQIAIEQEFKNIYTLLDFNSKGYDIFRQWYIDGRDYRHIVVDENAISEGIKDIRWIDPRKIKKVREITKQRNAGGVEIVTDVHEYFVYNDSGIASGTDGIKLSPDVIAYTPSGLNDENGNVIGYLHQAIKPANMLKYLEDSVVIYMLTRAPDRRVFYIDVADLPKSKAEQYVQDVMNKYRNKVVYDSTTGSIKDDRQNFTMMEDYWLPRRSNGRSTEITTLPGMQGIGMDPVQYFLNKLLKSLNVPASRINAESQFSLGRDSQITRDEVKFAKFVDRLRRQFCNMFDQLLRVQLVLKGVILPEDWDLIRSKIKYIFAQDNYFAEMKENEIFEQRLNMLDRIQPYVGQYFTEEYVKEKILRLSTEDQDDLEADFEVEMSSTPKNKKG